MGPACRIDEVQRSLAAEFRRGVPADRAANWLTRIALAPVAEAVAKDLGIDGSATA